MAKVADLGVHKSYPKIYAVKSKQLELLVDSIKENGVLEPIVITKKKKIISGVQRILSCKALNINTIPAFILDDVKAEDEIFLILSYNRRRDKSIIERWNEIQILKKRWGKRQGERTDLSGNAEKENTRKKIALYMNLSEGNVHKLTVVAENDLSLLSLIDAREISLHEAYDRVQIALKKVTKNASSTDAVSAISVEAQRSNQGAIPEKEVIICTCPNCKHKFTIN